MRYLKSGEQGERAAEAWFLNNGWHMVRTQPPISILGIVTVPMAAQLRRFMPRLALFGPMIVARLGKGGVPDYTGYKVTDTGAKYRVCEVKEATGNSMRASRLSKQQRDFMERLPEHCAAVGIFWIDTQKFEMFEFQKKGSYQRDRRRWEI